MPPALRGRSIGLKATMSKEQMKAHLIWIRKVWMAEGFSEEEVTSAILAKVHPLLNGYYWTRFPESSKRLAEVLQELGYPVGVKPKPPAGRRPRPKAEVAVANRSYADQFQSLLAP